MSLEVGISQFAQVFGPRGQFPRFDVLDDFSPSDVQTFDVRKLITHQFLASAPANFPFNADFRFIWLQAQLLFNLLLKLNICIKYHSGCLVVLHLFHAFFDLSLITYHSTQERLKLANGLARCAAAAL